MTKFELTRTAGRWRRRSRTYVALAILFVTAWLTNAKDLTLPDPKLTPGAIRHDLSKREICAYAAISPFRPNDVPRQSAGDHLREGPRLCAPPVSAWK